MVVKLMRIDDMPNEQIKAMIYGFSVCVYVCEVMLRSFKYII